MSLHEVAPIVGAWIEICICISMLIIDCVAPIVGAWIEIDPVVAALDSLGSRSYRGSVD